MKKLLFTLVMVFAVVILKAEDPVTVLFNEAFGPQGSWGTYTGPADEYTGWTDNRAGHTADPIQINNWKQSAGYDGASADMAFQSRWAAYSFTFTEIDIEGYENLKLSFGLYWDSWFAAGYKPKIEVRADGGTWILLADADEPWPTPATQVENVWKKMTISTGIPEGKKLDIKFSTHNDAQNMCIDDVILTGVEKDDLQPEPEIAWNFETDGDAEGWAGIGTTVVSVQNGALKALVNHWEGPKISITGLAIDAEKYTRIEIALKVNAFTGDVPKNVRAFFNAPDAARLVTKSFTPDADNYVVVELDMGAHSLWTGTITQLRLDICYGGGQDVDVDYIKFKKDEAAPEEYTLTVNITGQGSVEVNDIAYTAPVTVVEGTVLNLKALADAGCQFDGWSGDHTSANADEIVTMDADKVITATFTPITADDFILVLMDFEEPLGTDGYVVGLTQGHASAERIENPLKQGINTSDWVLKSDLNPYGAEARFITFVFDEDVTLHGKSKTRAMFYVDPNDSGNALHAQMEFYDENDVMVSSGNQWFGDGYSPGEWRTAVWAGNNLTDVTFRKVKITFWDDWGGSGVARPVYIDNFELLNDGDVYETGEEFTLTVSVAGEGVVNVDGEPYTDVMVVEDGTELTLTAVPADGFVFDGWSGDITSTNAEETITMDANKTLTATFSAAPVFNVFAWEFETDGDSEGWAGVGTATVIAVEDGHLKAVHDIALDNEGPKIINAGLQIAAADFTHAEIRMKTVDWTGEGKQLRFFWGREDSPNLGGDKLIVVGGITPDADIYQTIKVDLNHAEWKGTVSTIRLDLLQWNGKEVHVDYIKLIGPAKMPPTARLQLIHNAADLAAANVDVFVNGEIFKEDFAFRTASPFENVPAGVDLTIDIAPADAGIEGSVFQTTVNLMEDEAYIVVANGIVSTEGYDPVEPFAVYPYTPAREAAVKSDETDLLVFHGATDAPTVSVWVMDGENELFSFSYGEYEGYLSLPASNYALEVRTEDGSQVVATYSVPLASLNLEGAALTVLASGFLNPAVNSDGPAFGLFVATAAGGDLLPLPLYVPPFEYTPLLMDFELPLGTDGYKVESAWGQIEYGVIDNPVSVGINTSDKVYKSYREAGNWNSGIKFVFDSDVDDLGKKNIRVKIHPVDRALNHVYFKFYDENNVVVSEGWNKSATLPAGEWSYAEYSKGISGLVFRKLDLNFSDSWGNTTSESTVYFDDLELFTPPFDYTPLLMDFEKLLGTDGYNVQSAWGQVAHGVVKNPNKAGINLSDSVYKGHREAGNWNSGISFIFDSDVDDLGKKNIRVKVHPVDRALNHVYFKFYDGNNVVVSEGWNKSAALPAGQWSYAEYSQGIADLVFRKLEIYFSDSWGNTTSEGIVYFDDLELFTPQFTLTLVAEPNGVGTLTGAGDYAEGDSVEISATAADNYVFVKWALADGTAVSNAASFTYTMPAAATTLKAHFQSTVGVGELSFKNLTIYPNPATDFVKISLGSDIQGVYITDLAARIVYFNSSVNANELNISTSQFEPGVYLVSILSNDGVATRKLQIVK